MFLYGEDDEVRRIILNLTVQKKLVPFVLLETDGIAVCVSLQFSDFYVAQTANSIHISAISVIHISEDEKVRIASYFLINKGYVRIGFGL